MKTITGLLLISSLFLLISDQRGNPCEQCEERLRNLRRDYDQQGDRLLVSHQENDRLIGIIDSLQGVLLTIEPTQSIVENNGQLPSSGSTPSATSNPVGEDCNALRAQIEDLILNNKNLSASNRRLSVDNNRLIRRVSELERQVNALQDTVRVHKLEIKRLREELAAVKAELDNKNKQLTCIRGFFQLRDSLKQNARVMLDSANIQFRRFDSLKQGMGENLADSTENRMVAEIWDVYSQFGKIPIPLDCPDFGSRITMDLDLKDGQSHLNSAKILAFGYGDVVSELGKDTTWAGMIDRYNRDLLMELGQALAKGGYDNKSDAEAIILQLPNVIRASPSGTGDEIKQIFQESTERYASGNYLDVINTYNAIKFFLDAEIFEGRENEIAELGYAVAMILLRDLDNVGSYRALSIKGSWLYYATRNRQSQQDAAIGILQNIIRDRKTLNGDIVKRAYRALELKYSTK